MIEIIKPLKRLPDRFRPGGDYAATQYALILGLLTKEDLSIRNFNQGKDTAHTISFMNSIGCRLERSATEIEIKSSGNFNIPECAELEYRGGILPLTLIIGFLAGKNVCCTVQYSDQINPDMIDVIIKNFNKYGIDIFHEADSRIIIFRAALIGPVQDRLSAALPYLKNCLLMYGLSSGQSITIEEIITTDTLFEELILKLGGQISSQDIKMTVMTNPNDPRKKIRTGESDYKRKIELKNISGINGGDIEMPSDLHSTAALIILAILKKSGIVLSNVTINDGLGRFLKLLKSSSVDIELNNRQKLENWITFDISITGSEIKGRKISETSARSMMELIPYLAVVGGAGNGNMVIRDVSEYGSWLNFPLKELAVSLENQGIRAGAMADGLVIEGKSDSEGGKYGPYLNREIGLAFYMMALSETVKATYEGFELIADNYPELLEEIRNAYDRQLLSKQA